ncbi:uncharacterized protein LOC128852245 [Cuculus canorus]|uniref:uncharacterized protein LOC128852245 n=1 Tax=Cuculus canorus TaxID=55661 RepID=UPI0023AB193E|nr:uncharacterized protein LOC128852245 [Cuculus canorus]
MSTAAGDGRAAATANKEESRTTLLVAATLEKHSYMMKVYLETPCIPGPAPQIPPTSPQAPPTHSRPRPAIRPRPSITLSIRPRPQATPSICPVHSDPTPAPQAPPTRTPPQPTGYAHIGSGHTHCPLCLTHVYAAPTPARTTPSDPVHSPQAPPTHYQAPPLTSTTPHQASPTSSHAPPTPAPTYSPPRRSRVPLDPRPLEPSHVPSDHARALSHSAHIRRRRPRPSHLALSTPRSDPAPELGPARRMCSGSVNRRCRPAP